MADGSRKSDLSPQLGYPGGPCQVMDRIRQSVRNPKLVEELVDDIETGDDLSNAEASKVYSLETERGAKAKFLRRLRITPHAQYRMDQRGVTVGDVRVSLMNFAKKFYDSKSQDGFFYRERLEDLARGKKILWLDKELGRLTLVFTGAGTGTVTLITAYWEGLSDPRPVDESTCRVAARYALRIAPTPGVQTYVTQDSAKGIAPTPESQEPESAAPLPGSATPGGTGRNIGKFEYNTPDSDSKITPRTLGVPGEQYGNPTNVLNNYITRRTMTAAAHLADRWVAERIADRWVESWNVGERGGPQPTRQRRQAPELKRQEHRKYRAQRRDRTRKALKRYHQFCKRNQQCLKQRKLYRKNPGRYRRRAPQNKDGGTIILYDQQPPPYDEITQPGDDVNYEAEGPSTYKFKPDEKKGVPPGHKQPSNQTENVPPASSRVIPDQMKDTLRDQQTYMKSACVVAVSEIGGELALLKVRDRNYVPRIKVVREMVAGTEIAHVFDTWTGWSEGVNEHGIGVVSSALLVEVDEGQKKVPTGDSGTGRKIREILGARTMDAAIEIIMGNLVKGCTFISDGKRTVLVEYDGNPKKGGTEPELHTLKSGITMARTNHGVFLEGAGYTEEYQDGSDLKSSEVRKETAEKALDAAKDVEDVAAALARSRKKDRSDPFNAVRATDNMTTSSQIVTVPAERRMLVYLVPEEVDFVGIDNELPKGRKPKVKIQVFGFKDWDSEDPKPVELKGDLEVFRLFTYGSMMGRPSHTKDVIRSYKATLSGYHRAYNRSSQSRDGISVIGTEPGGKLEGLIHEYPVSMGHRVLGQVDRREGFRTERPEDKNSYIRHPINVKTPDGIARAIVYLSNPDGPNYNKPLTPVQAAKEVLAHPKAQKYLRGLVTAVEEHGIKAPYIKKVNDRVSKGSAVKKASRIATTIDEILQNTGPSVMRRVQGVSASGHRFNPKKGIWTFRVLGSQGKTYTVRVKGIRKGNVARLEKAQVRVSCSCPYFRWQGPEHWAKKHGYLYGKQVGTASDPAIKDPKGKHWACKHAVAALRMARNYRFGSGEDGWSLDGPLVAMADPVCVAVRYKQAKPEKALYTAVFLDDPTALKRWWVEETGIPLLSKHYGHHMTIKFKPDAQEVVDLPIGKRASIRIVGWAGDAKGQAVKVESSVRSTKKIAHITVATDGTSPVYSNKLLAKGVTAANGRLGGRVGYQSTKGREVFDLKGTIYELLSKKGPRTAMLPEQVTDERDHGVRRDEPEDGDGSKLPGDAEEGDG